MSSPGMRICVSGSIAVKVGDAVKAGARIGRLGNTGPSDGPHLHLGLLDKPDPIAGRSLPFVFDSFTLVGAVDFDASKEDRLVIAPQSRQVQSEYPLYGGVLNLPSVAHERGASGTWRLPCHRGGRWARRFDRARLCARGSSRLRHPAAAKYRGGRQARGSDPRGGRRGSCVRARRARRRRCRRAHRTDRARDRSDRGARLQHRRQCAFPDRRDDRRGSIPRFGRWRRLPGSSPAARRRGA